MTNVRLVATTDGPQLTVNAMLKDPLLIPTRVLQIIDQMFIAERLLRNGGNPAGGSVLYYQSSPLFADTSSEYVEEYGEIPIGTVSVGTPVAARTRKRALGIRISQEMVDRNQVDRVNQQITAVRNTMVSDWDGVFFKAITTTSGVNTTAATTTWASSSSKIRKDVMAAAKAQTDLKLGFNPDTLVINPSSRIDLIDSAEINIPFQGSAAGQSPRLTGDLGPIFNFAGLDVFQSYSCPAGTAVVMERGTAGFYADERALQATPLYRHNPTETWRSDVIRSSYAGLDQPGAVTLITGV